MKANALETHDILRAAVIKAEVLKTDETSVLLKTEAVVAAKKPVSSASSDMAGQRELAKVGAKVEGRLRLEVVSDHAVRIRYAEGTALPENKTPMVSGALPSPTRCKIAADAKQVSIVTARMKLTLFLDPYRVEVRTPDGRKVCGIGGPEKSHFCTWDSFNTGICRLTQDGSALAVENFDLAPDECIYGLGEKFIKLNKTGQTISLRADDPCSVLTQRSYKNVPFFVSTHGYGVYFNHSSLMRYWVGSLTATDIQVAAEDDFLDYYVFLGTLKELLATYTDLTGKGSLPPLWSFGYWQSKISYSSAQETLDVARQLRKNKIPCDVIHLDTHWYERDWYCNLEFDKTRFPDPQGYLQKLAKLGFKVCLWQLPYIPEGSQLFADLKAVDGFVKNADGGIFDSKICFTPGFKGIVGVIDYTNPAAVRVHQEYFRRLFRMGVKVIKTDFGESAPLDGVYHDGSPGHIMHNLYPLLYNKAVFEVTKEETGDGIVWARSAWAGSQRYPLHWGGDNSPNYPNMLPQLAGGLSFGLSGFQFWSQDIGGFCGDASDRLLTRWMQWSIFLSHIRIHGFGNRELYKFAPETVRICREFLRLRYRLLPYLYGMAQKCVAESLPFARALVVEYQDDPNVWNMYDEFLCGDSLLVAPLFTEDNRRRVYLPQGVWTDWWTRERLAGGRWLEVEAPLNRIPLYIREGALIPLGPVQNYVDEVRTKKLELLVSRFARDGHTHFEIPVNGEWLPVEYTAARGKHTLVVGKSSVKVSVTTLGGKAVTVRR